MGNYNNEDLKRLFFMPKMYGDGDAASHILEFAKEKNIDLNMPIIPIFYKDIEIFFESKLCTIIHVCAYFNQPITLEKLNKNGVKIDIPDDKGNQPIHYIWDINIAKKLQGLGADVNAKNQNEEIPAMTYLRNYLEFYRLWPSEETINEVVLGLEEWTKMGALLDTKNKSAKNLFDIFSQNFQQHADYIQSFYQNFPKNQYSISANGEVTTLRLHHGGSGTETGDSRAIWIRSNEERPR